MELRLFEEYTQKVGVTMYHHGVGTAGEGIVIILLSVTTSTLNIYLNNVT